MAIPGGMVLPIRGLLCRQLVCFAIACLLRLYQVRFTCGMLMLVFGADHFIGDERTSAIASYSACAS
jgi:hypothetical protein